MSARWARASPRYSCWSVTHSQRFALICPVEGLILRPSSSWYRWGVAPPRPPASLFNVRSLRSLLDSLGGFAPQTPQCCVVHCNTRGLRPQQVGVSPIFMSLCCTHHTHIVSNIRGVRSSPHSLLSTIFVCCPSYCTIFAHIRNIRSSYYSYSLILVQYSVQSLIFRSHNIIVPPNLFVPHRFSGP